MIITMILKEILSTSLIGLSMYFICLCFGIFLIHISIKNNIIDIDKNRDMCISRNGVYKCLIIYTKGYYTERPILNNIFEKAIDSNSDYVFIFNNKIKSLYKKKFNTVELLDKSNYDVIITIDNRYIVYEILIYDPYNTEFVFRIKK